MKDLSAHKSGFTLIELLVALTIMMMIFLLGFQGYKLYSESTKKDLSKFSDAFDKYKQQELFSTALHGIIPYMVKAAERPAFYFLGRAEGFTAVTMTPVFAPGAAAVIRVFREQQKDGSYQLVYEEASLSGMVLVEPSQILPFTHRMIVMANLPQVGFAYFGVRSKKDLYESISRDESILSPEWFVEYDGLYSELHPSKVKITLDKFELILPVPQRSQLGDVTSESVF